MRIGGIIAVVALVGCRTPYATVAPRPPEQYTEMGRTSGSACGYLVFGHIPWKLNNRVARAYADAVERTGARSLVDTSITDRWDFWGIFTRLCTDLEGTAIR